MQRTSFLPPLFWGWYRRCVCRFYARFGYSLDYSRKCDNGGCAEDFYDYIDGLHGDFPPDSSELILETEDEQKARKILKKYGDQLRELILNQDQMPQTVCITQIDLRAKLSEESDHEYNSIEDQLTKISFINLKSPDWWL